VLRRLAQEFRNAVRQLVITVLDESGSGVNLLNKPFKGTLLISVFRGKLVQALYDPLHLTGKGGTNDNGLIAFESQDLSDVAPRWNCFGRLREKLKWNKNQQ
jgi:hypothetical protein